MKQKYRNFEIFSEKEKCLGGWDEVYWGAYRESDGYELACGFGDGTAKEMLNCMKELVDRFVDVYENNEEVWEECER